MSKKKKTPENEENVNISEEIKETNETGEINDTGKTNDIAAEKADKPAKPEKAKRKFNVRSFEHGSMSVVLTIVFIAAVVVVNIIVGLISERFDTTADLTNTGLYTLDETTEKYLADTLGTDITLTVLRTEKDFEEQSSAYKQINELLKKMEMTGGHVKVNYLDLDQNPNYTSQFKGETLAANYIVVECEKTGRHKILSPYEYFSFNQSYLQSGSCPSATHSRR